MYEYVRIGEWQAAVKHFFIKSLFKWTIYHIQSGEFTFYQLLNPLIDFLYRQLTYAYFVYLNVDVVQIVKPPEERGDFCH